MIISYPTALYKDEIPGVGDSGNVTWLISSTDPPRSDVNFIQLPLAETLRKRPPPEYTAHERRRRLGNLVFTLVEGAQGVAGSGKLQFEIGQIFDFDETDDVPTATTALVPKQVDLQHNTNLLDLSSLGLTDAEIVAVTDQSEARKKVLEDEISILQSEIDDLQVAINENQKTINEANKVFDAVTILQDEALVKKLEQKIASLKSQRTVLIDQLNEANSAVAERYDELLSISQLVR